ncbi:hypothetical protein FYJ86_08525 [Corynebacterium urealyticum]|nr:hypothetical protein FYJ86_08525 [Corynebacterium urealyticum]
MGRGVSVGWDAEHAWSKRGIRCGGKSGRKGGVQHEVKIIAHRGASKHRPEHTIGAYELAAAQGADGYECDIRLTRDGHAVCIHDRTVDRVSDGTGAVSRMTLAELKALNFGTSTRPATVLELRELLEFLQDMRHSAGAGQPELFIETKHPHVRSLQVEVEMHRQLAAAGLAGGEGIYLISFDSWSLWRSRRINPQVERIQLRRKYHPPTRPLLRGSGIARRAGWSIEQAMASIRGDRRGAPADYIWTVDQAEQLRWIAQRGARWVATNYPGEAAGWLQNSAGGGAGQA